MDVGGELIEERGGPLSACCGMCSSTAGCEGFAWGPWGACYLKRGIGSATHNPGIISGLVGNGERHGHPVNHVRMFRALVGEQANTYTLENNNVADAGGCLKYIHTELIVEHQLPDYRVNRKYDVDAIAMWDVSFRNHHSMVNSPDRVGEEFGPFLAYDFGESTNRHYEENGYFARYGDWVGMQPQQGDPRIVTTDPIVWYSLGGFCPNVPFREKGDRNNPNERCVKYGEGLGMWGFPNTALNGGYCGDHFTDEPLGEPGCTYTYAQPPRMISLDAISGIISQDCGGRTCRGWNDFRRNCVDGSLKRKFDNAGNIVHTDYCVEYDIHPFCADRCNDPRCGALLASDSYELGLAFWRGRCDAARFHERIKKLSAAVTGGGGYAGPVKGTGAVKPPA